MKYEPFEDPIHIPQFYFTRDMWEIIEGFIDNEQEKGQLLNLLCTWALDNVMDVEYAKTVTPNVIDVFNRVVSMMFSGINKYRWDYFNGGKGGRPVRVIPRLEQQNNKGG